MFNRQPFNRATSLVTGVSGLATMKLSDQAILYKEIRHSGISKLEMNNTLSITRNIYHSGQASNLLKTLSNATKEFLYNAETGNMMMDASANQIVSGEALIRLENINLAPGDELVIDTEKMTVTLNGGNAARFVEDNSDVDLMLLNGLNSIVYSDNSSSRSINIDIIWKDRWL